MAKYYDIDDILAENELVPVLFQEPANGVGLFDSSDDTNKAKLNSEQSFSGRIRGLYSDDCVSQSQVESGSKGELPFWLARELHFRQAVSIKVPPCFNKRTREEIEADAAHVDLRNRCPYFYDIGCKIAPLVADKTIGSVLLVAFRTRYKEVLIKAHTAAVAVTPKFLTLLTKEETKMYEAAQSSTAAFKKWRMGGPRLQKASVLGRKRKPVE